MLRTTTQPECDGGAHDETLTDADESTQSSPPIAETFFWYINIARYNRGTPEWNN
jgi:hypothetical protein